MRKTYLLIILSLLISQFCFSQQKYKINFEQLKEFEGLYEYYNHTTLKMAASPKDSILYTILDKSRYPLAPTGKDLFLYVKSESSVFQK